MVFKLASNILLVLQTDKKHRIKFQVTDNIEQEKLTKWTLIFGRRK